MIPDKLFLAGLLILGSALPVNAQPVPQMCTHPRLVVDEAGEAVTGSKANLATALAEGQAVQVGFSLPAQAGDAYYLTHWINPSGFGIMGGNIFTHSPKVHLQLPDDTLVADDLQGPGEIAVTLIGTDGLLYFRSPDQQKLTTSKVRSWWCTDE